MSALKPLYEESRKVTVFYSALDSGYKFETVFTYKSSCISNCVCGYGQIYSDKHITQDKVNLLVWYDAIFLQYNPWKL